MALPLPRDGEFLPGHSDVFSAVLTLVTFSLLFATTNHIERLDPALSRPGRMDVWINFKNATKWQAEEIFKNFFPYKLPEPPTPPASQEGEAAEQKPAPKRKTQSIPTLEEAELTELAKRFAEVIPDDEMSVGGVVVQISALG